MVGWAEPFECWWPTEVDSIFLQIQFEIHIDHIDLSTLRLGTTDAPHTLDVKHKDIFSICGNSFADHCDCNLHATTCDPITTGKMSSERDLICVQP